MRPVHLDSDKLLSSHLIQTLKGDWNWFWVVETILSDVVEVKNDYLLLYLKLHTTIKLRFVICLLLSTSLLTYRDKEDIV